jgi:hypothetical protein
VFFAAAIGMAQGEETRKLMCECGKQPGTFKARGLELYCRYCKHTTTVAYGIASLSAAIAWVERLRRRFRP